MTVIETPHPRFPRFFQRRRSALRALIKRFENVMFTRTRYSQSKMVAMAVAGTASQLGYYPVWKYLFPQPYENLWLRFAGCVLFLPLALQTWWPRRLKSWLPSYWYTVITFNLPFFIGYMTLRNGASAPWLMTHLASMFLTMMLFDLLSFALIFGTGTLAAVSFYLLAGHGPWPTESLRTYLPLVAFALGAGPLASLSQVIAEQSRISAITSASENIAHELRTPLGSLRIAGQAIRRFLPQLINSHRVAYEAGLAVSDLRISHLRALERSINVIDREVTHADTVIDMLLLAARPVGKMHSEPVQALATVEQALQRYPYASRNERDRIHWQPGNDFTLFGSQTLLVHVVFNLLRNALAHTGRAGKGEIHLSIETVAHEHRIQVRDTGPGIPPDVLPRIFNHFYSFSGDKQGASGGLGIGLAFSRAVVEGMGGEIRCISRWGEFTEFTLAFPAGKEGT